MHFSPQSLCCRLETLSPICTSTERRETEERCSAETSCSCTSSVRPRSRSSCGWASLALFKSSVSLMRLLPSWQSGWAFWWNTLRRCQSGIAGLTQLWIRNCGGDEIEEKCTVTKPGRYKYEQLTWGGGFRLLVSASLKHQGTSLMTGKTCCFIDLIWFCLSSPTFKVLLKEPVLEHLRVGAFDSVYKLLRFLFCCYAGCRCRTDLVHTWHESNQWMHLGPGPSVSCAFPAASIASDTVAFLRGPCGLLPVNLGLSSKALYPSESSIVTLPSKTFL